MATPPAAHLTLLDRTHDTVTPVAEPPAGHETEAGDSRVEQGTMLSVRSALEQLAELADAKLITATEHKRKRAEILARI